MPVWHITHPANAFTDAEKLEVAQKITGIYDSLLPRFYVNVFFHEIAKSSCFVGGEPSDDFVRLEIAHIARTMNDPEMKAWFLDTCKRVMDPYVADRGRRWEMHIQETPFDLWTVQGLRPPPPNSEAEKRWKAENRPSAYA